MNVKFKQRLKNLEVLAGPLVTLRSSEIAEMMAEVGFDWVWIEMEHSPTDLTTAQRIVQAVGDRCATLVRSPWNDAVWIKRILDIGCDGIVIPQIKSASDAREAVSACRYPPAGIRSVGIARAQKFGMDLQGYIEKANDSLIVVLQIEHVEGVKEINAILDVPGIDAIVIGPYDLSASMGLIGQVGHDDVQAGVGSVITACIERRTPVGAFSGDVRSARAFVKRGCTLIALGADALFLWKSAQQALSELRSSG